MRRWSIIIGLLTATVLCIAAILFPICRGRFILKELTKAVENRDIVLVKNLLDKKVNVNGKLSNGRTLLYMAVIPETPTDVHIVKLLLEKGADVNAIGGDFDSTPLLLAVMLDPDNKCPDPEIVKLLLEYGANANVKDKLGLRPLHVACLSQCVDIAKILLDSGADVNMNTQSGSTFLHAAVVFKNLNMVELLLNYGIDVNAKDQKVQTALDIATEKGYTDIAELIKMRGGKTGAEWEANKQSLIDNTSDESRVTSDD